MGRGNRRIPEFSDHPVKEALYWSKSSKGRVQCELCPNNCSIAPGKQGICNIRENRDGNLYALMYNRIAAANIDPIEKKPLYHFLPATPILSLGTAGCTLHCQFCQNWHMVEGNVNLQECTPEEAVALAIERKVLSIAYTYNEPLVWFEYVLDTARLARAQGIRNVLVTNGYLNPQPFQEILPFIDALNIDLKSIREHFYSELCGGSLQPVLNNIRKASEQTIVEVTNLIIPGENDSREEIEELVSFVASLPSVVPLHFSRYSPQYKMSNPPTPSQTLLMAYEIATKQLPYVYLGNIRTSKGSNTYCHNCQNLLVERDGYFTRIVGLKQSSCMKCNTSIPVVLPL